MFGFGSFKPVSKLQYQLFICFSESRQIAIDMHNKFRSIIAQGSARSRNVIPLPTAAKMRKVTYSMELEEKATRVAEACDVYDIHLA
jgi:hypothetical protein